MNDLLAAVHIRDGDGRIECLPAKALSSLHRWPALYWLGGGDRCSGRARRFHPHRPRSDPRRYARRRVAARARPAGAGDKHPGLFAAGDVRHGAPRRVGGAVGDGAMAVALAHRVREALSHGGKTSRL